MKRIITLFTTVLILSTVLASTVHAQPHPPEDSVEEPPLTAEELANLVEPYPDLHIDPTYAGPMPTLSQAQDIINLLTNLEFELVPEMVENATPPQESEYSTHATSSDTVRKNCDTHLWVKITWQGKQYPVSHVGSATHSGQMETADGEFVRLLNPPHSVEFHFPYKVVIGNFSVYGFAGQSDDPYNRRVDATTWRLGSTITVRAYILNIGIDIISNRDLSCRIYFR